MDKDKTALVLFTRDLRVRDNPALAAAAEAGRVVPLFVFDDAILGAFGAPNRVAFLLEALADLRGSLREIGAPLAVRRGDVVTETLAVAHETGAEVVHLSADVSRYAARRMERLAEAIDVRPAPGVTVVPPRELVPAGADHYRVFTPYWRRWREAPRRPLRRAPRALGAVKGLALGELPSVADLTRGATSPDRAQGGESEGQRVLERFLRSGLDRYGGPPALADDGTSRLSPYLHFGCLSPLEVERRTERNEAFIRQLCWRDFYQQLLAANPRLAVEDYRPRGDHWHDDDDPFDAWREGRTGFPIVDAGMRQLAREGWMHNRARLLTASFLVKDLYVDWRLGAEHFFELLVDGDLASNAGNWQWVAGTGTDTRPNRVFNPISQAKRLDPDGEYVRRYVPELRPVEGGAVHEPWRLDEAVRARLDYPPPIVDHREAAERFQQLRLC